MNRTTTALLAGLEALITIAIGIAVPLVPLTVLWATTFAMGPDWFGFWRAAVDIWLLGHGVDLMVQLPSALAVATGLPGAEAAFPVSIALLGFSVLTIAMGVRVGRRSALGGSRVLGVLVSAVVFGALSALVLATAGEQVARPSHLQALTLPALVYLLSAIAGSEWAIHRLPDGGRDALAAWERALLERWPRQLRAALASVARGASAAVAGLVGVASVAVAMCLVLSYSTVIGLYEALHAGAAGGAALTLLQASLLPNAIIWALSWIVGPGFALGAATSVSPAGTTLGSLPGLPLFGALPQGTPAIGWLGVLIPIVLGAAAGWSCRRRIDNDAPLWQPAAVGAGIGVVTGIALVVLAWFSGGALGPGRLASVGPDPLLVGAFAALEVGAPAIIAAVLGVLGRRMSVPGNAPAPEGHAETVGRTQASR
ncbi:DUF6350 family protein [Rathayibacter sp. YIM 133350]|uniref:cell division protein PerM n=1 Tax=Rathayibacter sp. YIM 133350 TaxID=3131992 RepID=UPI00307FB8D6